MSDPIRATSTGSTAPLTFRQKLSTAWEGIKQFFGFSRTGAAVNASSTQPPVTGKSSSQGMAAVARARNPGLATMTRSQKVDIIKQNLQGTLQTLNGRLERLGPNDSTSRAVLQQAKAKVEESIQKMNTLPEGEVLNQLKEGNPECTNVITTLDQAMAASQEVSHLLTA